MFTMAGSFIGFYRPKIHLPQKVNKIKRKEPETKPFLIKTLRNYMLCSVLPFLTVFITFR